MPNEQCNPDGLKVSGPLMREARPGDPPTEYVWINFSREVPGGVSEIRRVVVGPDQESVREFAERYPLMPEVVPKGSCECGRGDVVVLEKSETEDAVVPRFLYQNVLIGIIEHHRPEGGEKDVPDKIVFGHDILDFDNTERKGFGRLFT